MAVKLKRKFAEENESVEPLPYKASPVKKSKLSSAEQLVSAIQGFNGFDALREWLYHISSEKEKSQMDKETSTKPQGNNDETNRDEGVEIEEALVTESPVGDSGLANDHIDSFLLAGGSVNILINLLGDPASIKTNQARYIFKAVTKVTLRLAAEHPDMVQETVETFMYFLQTYLQLCSEMLKNQRSARDRVCVMELLTAMVTLHNKLGKEVLARMNLDSETVQQLASSRASLQVRVAYLNFLVGLLIDADNGLVKSVLNKPWLIKDIFEGLEYDPCQTLVLLLNALQNAVVKNPVVPKTSKLTIFSIDGILCLLRLYKWKGPSNRPRNLSHWAAKKAAGKPKPLTEVDVEELEAVTNSVHDLLIFLLTNHRFGIIFRDVGIGHQSERHNKVILRLLQRIGHPWEDAKMSELIAKILGACPDSLKATLASLEPYFVPRSSSKWGSCANFIKEVLSAQCPEEVLKRQIANITAKNLGSAAVEMCTPPAITRALCSDDAAALLNSDTDISHPVMEILVSMLRKMNSFMNAMREWAEDGLFPRVACTATIRFLTEFLLKNMPSLYNIEKSWEFWSSNVNFEEADGKPAQILSFLLEILELYQKMCPSAVETLCSAHSSFKTTLTETVLSAGSSAFRPRVYSLLLAMNDQSVSLENVTMKKPLSLLFLDLLDSNESVRCLAASVLQTLIDRAGYLEGSHQEALVWLTSFTDTFSGEWRTEMSDIELDIVGIKNDSQGSDSDAAADIAKLIVESMINAITDRIKYDSLIAVCEETTASTESVVNRNGVFGDNVVTIRGYFDDLVDGYNYTDPGTGMHATTTSPVLPALLDAVAEYSTKKKKKYKHRKEEIDNILSRILLRLLFRASHPGPLLHLVLIEKDTSFLPTSVVEYYKKWHNGLSELTFPSLVDDMCRKVMAVSENYLMRISEKNLNLSIIEPGVVQLFYMLVYHAAQLCALNRLCNETSNTLQKTVLKLLEVITHVDNLKKEKETSCLYQCMKAFLTHPWCQRNFHPFVSADPIYPLSEKNLTRLIIDLISFTKHNAACYSLFVYHRKHLCSTLSSSIERHSKKMLQEDPVYIVDAFQLPYNEVSWLLREIVELPPKCMTLRVDGKIKISPWAHLTAYLLKRIANLRKERENEDRNSQVVPIPVLKKVIQGLEDILRYLIEDIDISPYSEALLLYFQSCPQQIKEIQPEFLALLLRAKEFDENRRNLIIWVSSHRECHLVQKQLMAASEREHGLLDHPEVLFSALNIVVKEDTTSLKPLLELVYQKFGSDIEQAVTSAQNHPTWLTSNMTSVLFLVSTCMANDTKQKLCEELQSRAPKLTLKNLHYLKLIEKVLEEYPPQLLRILFAWLGAALKKHEKSGSQETLMQEICLAIIACVKKAKEASLSSVLESNVWQEAIRLSLKLGLRTKSAHSNGQDEIPPNEENRSAYDFSSIVFRMLSSVVCALYHPEDQHDHIAMILKMTVQHSEFVNAMMENGGAKSELVHLVRVLVERDPKSMDSKHIPVFLAAYSARLTEADQEILKLLHLYESNGVGLATCRPYLWGEEGGNHYSVWSLKSNQNLWQQPRPDQVLKLLNFEAVEETIANFPIERTLDGWINEKNKCQERIYDPAFYLPLFSHLLSPESPIYTYNFMRSGALGLTMAALSSLDSGVRAAAYATLSRFCSHLHMSRGRDKDLLLHFMSALQQGVSALGENAPRLTCVVATFVARAALELTNPLSTLYRPITKFVLAKPVLNLKTVPEFMPLLHSEHVKYLEYRKWILEVLISGLRTVADVAICLDAVVFKLLLSFYSSRVADAKSKALVLRVVCAAVETPYGASCLVRDYCLTSWLHQTVQDLGSEDTSILAEIVNIVAHLWKSLSESAEAKKDEETGRFVPRVKDPAEKVIRLLDVIFPKLKGSASLRTLQLFVSTFYNVYSALPIEQAKLHLELGKLLDIIACCSQKSKVKSAELYDIINLGVCMSESSSLSSSVDPSTDLAISLKSLTIKWKQISCLESIGQ